MQQVEYIHGDYDDLLRIGSDGWVRVCFDVLCKEGRKRPEAEHERPLKEVDEELSCGSSISLNGAETVRALDVRTLWLFAPTH